MVDSGQRFRFGIFEFFPVPGDLFRRRRKIRLQNQVSRLLAVLLDRAGALVGREELRNMLWPGDTFIDFDSGLNKAVSELRATLGDSATKPRLVETIPRKGYRFIATVETGGEGGARHPIRGSRLMNRESLAVLPLVNQSGEAGEEYFSDGMTAELIAAVSRIASLRVISRTSAMRFKDTRKSLSAIARDLGVDAVVEGTVGRSGGKVRISAQLIFAPEDRHIWSATLERDMCDILELQSEIAAAYREPNR